MTINLGLVTSEAVILGCDSIASTTGYYLDPVALDWETDAEGKFVKDANGKYNLKFDFSDYESIVTNAWGGVTKMFQIYPDPSPMVAVTAGLAKLKDRPIASWAGEFFRASQRDTVKLTDCSEICNRFLAFMRDKYQENYANSPLPDALWDGPEFLVGGFGQDDDFGSVYRIFIKENLVHKQLGAGGSVGPTGIAWNGQSDAVERFLRGYDQAVKGSVERKIVAELKSHSTNVQKYVAETVNKILDKLGQKIPEDIEISVPELVSRVTQTDGYSLLSLMRALAVVKRQSALA